MNKPKSLIRELPEGFHFVVKWEDDDYPDLSWLGTFQSRDHGEDFIVDRRKGQLLGPSNGGEEACRVWAGDYPDEIHDEDGYIWELLDEDEGLYRQSTRPILKEYLSTGDRNSYEYYVSTNHGLHDLKYDGITMDDVVKWIERDYERLCDYGNYWFMQGCVVKLYFGYKEIAEHSLWGIESDRKDSYTTEVEEDLMAACLNDFDDEMILEAQALYLGLQQIKPLPEQKKINAARKRMNQLLAFANWSEKILAERQAAYEAQRAEWETKKDAK